MRFEWDAKKAASNYAKHGISFQEGIEVFDDPAALDKHDPGHSRTEDRYGRIGSTSRGVLAVVYTERERDVIRIINARKASRKKRKYYHGQERENRI